MSNWSIHMGHVSRFLYLATTLMMPLLRRVISLIHVVLLWAFLNLSLPALASVLSLARRV